MASAKTSKARRKRPANSKSASPKRTPVAKKLLPRPVSDSKLEIESDSQMVLESMGVCFHESDVRTFQLLRVNRRLREFLGYSDKELLALRIPDISHPEDWEKELVETKRLVAGEIKELVLEKRFLCQSGAVKWGLLTATMLRDKAGRALRRISIIKDIHPLVVQREARSAKEARARAALGNTTRYEVLIEGQLKALEMICDNQPLSMVLEKLVKLLEHISIGKVAGSVLLLDADQIHLRHGAAPSLPAAYNAQVHGLPIGESAGTCGTAAFRHEPVVVRDVTTDPLWAKFQDLAQLLVRHGLRSCWSVPIFGAGNEVLGTFAIYSTAPDEPDPRDFEAVSVVTRTAAIAIQKKRADQALAESEQRLKH
ncbi:MAG: domain S-box protein [Verrucomicrobiales bacterium]|nr:domain S-box protein [Verrucomicrobiales bacterium]